MANAATPDRRRLRGRLAMACAAALLVGREAAGDEAAASLHIAAPPARTWAALTDLMAWGAIFPDVVQISLEQAEGRPLRMHQVVRVLGQEIRHTSSVRLEPELHRLELELDPTTPSDVAALGAVWTVSSDGFGGSIVELRSRLTPRQPVPGFILHRILERSLRGSVEALAAEVTRRMAPVAAADDT